MTIKMLLQARHSTRAFLTAEPDYHYYPTQWQRSYTERRRAFDAPVMLLFFWTAPCKPVLI